MNRLKNNLQDLRREAGLSQEEVGRRLGGKAGSTVSHYESGKIELTQEMADLFAVALGVPVNRIKTFSEDSLGEDAPPYRTRSIPVEIISDGMLQAARSDFAQRLDKAEGREFEMLHAAIGEIRAEQTRRATTVILHEKGKAPATGPGGLSSIEVSEAAASSKAALEKLGVLPGPGGSTRSPGAGEPHPHKVRQSGSSSSETRTPRSGHGDKGQK